MIDKKNVRIVMARVHRKINEISENTYAKP